ncbi:hypothetical protein [Streptomyces rimosus]|uniref:hypothetical protein n=1 Tax=Streptomyces rimosus TaxID=1927 RepID=UPI0009978FC8|nr:hypothetical protein [Streptomyces rimosus]
MRVDAAARLPNAATSAGLSLRGMDRAELVLADPGLGQRLLLVLPVVVGGLLISVMLVVLLRMARTFRNGDFFVPGNMRASPSSPSPSRCWAFSSRCCT